MSAQNMGRGFYWGVNLALRINLSMPNNNVMPGDNNDKKDWKVNKQKFLPRQLWATDTSIPIPRPD